MFTYLINNLLVQWISHSGLYLHQKTFDSMSHNSLLKNLIKHGSNDNLVNRLDNFLNKRSQWVININTLSDPLNVHSGIQQG